MTPARSVPEWIGKTPDSAIPDRVKLRIVERQGDRCVVFGTRFTALDKPIFDHVIPLADGGENREGNLQALSRFEGAGRAWVPAQAIHSIISTPETDADKIARLERELAESRSEAAILLESASPATGRTMGEPIPIRPRASHAAALIAEGVQLASASAEAADQALLKAIHDRLEAHEVRRLVKPGPTAHEIGIAALCMQLRDAIHRHPNGQQADPARKR